MSVSPKLSKAMAVAKAMGRTAVTLPMPRSWQPKHVKVQCRRCVGTKKEKGSEETCGQCNGEGAEKLSPKAMRRWVLKNAPPPVVVKTEKEKIDE